MTQLKLQRIQPHSGEAGFTIIESLIAIIVVGILLTAIAPVIVLSVGTRVQSKRVELATQAAKTYIDGVTSGSIESPPITQKDSNLIAQVNAPSGNLNCKTDNEYCSSPKDKTYQVYCLDGSGDGTCKKDDPKDMLVQAFAYNPSTDEANSGYRLGIRVYRADAFKDGKSLEKSDDKKKATQSSFSGAISKLKAPLLEMTTDIASRNTTFADFCSRLENNKNTNSQCK
ncbi:hormogonium polysaccharide secretion pseudopilin HpsB [Mastigocoleus sp. MO_188.B34]|uniref:hormogonium polysaccharide secretion pseudopilin HpsB n=1 Tax=Mastigocoleus sp. MO_188.B34 TaxID=3036635 RepID=UPI00262FE4BE|nr:hormogonium polysaccharide secretion pseudopilin HpsB [Mastigocoleus sp. MO_188.B34]MDJ0696180.1 hormogonium polysaccharide secretion pseudopilin HpsB [Mastigocoleus sp. MO_188.B34]